jgi:hypothetical protein
MTNLLEKTGKNVTEALDKQDILTVAGREKIEQVLETCSVLFPKYLFPLPQIYFSNNLCPILQCHEARFL